MTIRSYAALSRCDAPIRSPVARSNSIAASGAKRTKTASSAAPCGASIRRQRRQPFRSVGKTEQQHRLLVHRRDRENARRDGVIGGCRRDRDILGPDA
ncbi:hypothetical protein ACVMDO_002140 [Bradyrhizobium sp. USDA 4513]